MRQAGSKIGWNRADQWLVEATMRDRRWWVLSASAALGAAGVGLPWAHNPLLADRSGLVVVFGEHASVPVTLALVVSVVLALAGFAAAGGNGGRGLAWVVVAAGLTALCCLGWYGIRIAGESVRAYGVDGAGNVVEPEAASRLGIGWYLMDAALLILITAALALRSSARR